MREERPAMLCFDGSEHARFAIERAGALLSERSRAVVVTVWQPLASMPFAQLAVMPDDVAEALGRKAREIAGEGVELARRAGFEPEPLVVAASPAWRKLVEVAKERDPAVIVLGSQGMSAVKFALLGSVASSVVRHADQPVLVVRRPKG